MKKRAEYRNDVKTRLTDEEYEAMQTFKALHGIDSDSAALARIARLLLLGVVGTLPANLTGVSSISGQSGRRQVAA
jgi:hypothetical protein